MAQANRDLDEAVRRAKRWALTERKILRHTVYLFLVQLLIILSDALFHLPTWISGGTAFLVLLLWLGNVFRDAGHAVMPLPDYWDEDVLRRTVDIHLRRWNISIVTLLLSLTWVCGILGWTGSRQRHWVILDHPWMAVLLAVALAWIAILALTQICFGPGMFPFQRRALRDEGTRAQQAKSALLGYPLAIVAMATSYGAVLYQPQWGSIALPAAIGGSVLVPGCYFLIQQARAGRNG